MLIYIFAALGAAYGAFLAYRRKGRALDIAFYAAAFLIIFTIVGLLINVLLLRAAVG